MVPLQLLVLLVLVPLLVHVLRRRKRRPDEPPLIHGWIPFLGKALEFGRNAETFLEEQRRRSGEVFTVHIAGKFMTFIMNPLMYPSIVKHGRQLDFHKFADRVVPPIFSYSPLWKFPGLHEDILRTFQLLQGDSLTRLTESMMGNLMLVLRQDHLSRGEAWSAGSLYDFCLSVMFEASFLTVYGTPAAAARHPGMPELVKDFVDFDEMFPLLVAEVPIWLLRRARSCRSRILSRFQCPGVSSWPNVSLFVKKRAELFEGYGTMTNVDKAGHHFAILWASVGNTIPATFWALYHLVSHPEALEVVQQEILNLLKTSGIEFSRDKDVRLHRDQLDQLLYLESAINESLRLSSASMNIRVAEEDFSLQLDSRSSVSVRRGDVIVLFPRSLHMDPEIYDDPQTFQFDRYVQDGREKSDFYKQGQKLKYYRMPFGSGSSKCPGRFFAINEIKQFLFLVLLYFDVRLEEGQTRANVDPSRAGLGILLPDKEVRFRYRVRSHKPATVELPEDVN
ncbi:uncharacterized protein V6R79_008909 [Siganus canaliculatus]